MKSIQKTRRKISKLNIDFSTIDWLHALLPRKKLRESAISDVVTILKKFSASITHLQLHSVSLPMPKFIEILSVLPNAEYLSLFHVCIVREKEDELANEEQLSLHQLKTLKLDNCSEEIVYVFNGLPPGVLQELTLSDGFSRRINLALLIVLFTQQSNIKKLNLRIEELDQHPDISSLDESTSPNYIFDHLQLEEFEFGQNEYGSRHAKLLAKQTTLKTLILRQGKIDSHVMNAINDKLSDLETLQIKVYDALAVPFKNIEKLRKLKNFTLESFNLKTIQIFFELDNSNISILELTDISICQSKTDDYDGYIALATNLIGKLVISAPNLRVLRFKHYCAPPMIISIMKNFNFVSVLEMKFTYRIEVKELIATIDDDLCFNPKLTELTIHNFPFEVSVLKKLIRMYPNLKKVAFYVPSKPIILSTFQFLLNGFGKMESLILETKIGTAEECLDYLRENKNNLKSVTLTCSPEINSQFTERKRRLKAVFDKIIYDAGDCILYMTDKIV